MKVSYDNYELLFPFGDFIYSSTLTEDELSFVKDLAEKSRDKDDASYRLVGNIKEQREDISITTQFQSIVDKHIKSFMYHQLDKQSLIKHAETPSNLNFEEMEYSLGQGPWFNFMSAGEFNPLHSHHGEVSGILIIQAPQEISDENFDDNNPNNKSNGKLEWVGSDCGNYRITAKEGDVFLFPSHLKHIVYPFHSNVERITSSWNVYNIKFKKPIEVEFL